MTIQDPSAVTVKKRLRMERAKLGVSQREAAARAGISQSVLEKYESRDNERIPNTRQLFRLARLYEVSTDYLLGRDEVDGADAAASAGAQAAEPAVGGDPSPVAGNQDAPASNDDPWRVSQPHG